MIFGVFAFKNYVSLSLDQETFQRPKLTLGWASTPPKDFKLFIGLISVVVSNYFM